jgi:hypothetical protein
VVGLCWHKWGNWKVRTAIVEYSLDIPDVLKTIVTHNGRVRTSKLVQMRKCVKCNKIQMEDL